MHSTLLLAAALPAALGSAVIRSRDASSSSSSSSASSASCSFTAKFDELSAPWGGLSDLKDEIPTPYHGLAYPGYHVAGLGWPSWTTPASSPNTIFYNFFQQATVGQPNITSVYAGGPEGLVFDPQSFYYSCIYPNPLPVYVPTNCTITARGEKPDGSVVTQDFQFVVPGGNPFENKVPQQKGVFGDGFRGIQNLAWVASPRVGKLAEVFPAFDDFTYTLRGSSAC